MVRLNCSSSRPNHASSFIWCLYFLFIFFFGFFPLIGTSINVSRVKSPFIKVIRSKFVLIIIRISKPMIPYDDTTHSNRFPLEIIPIQMYALLHAINSLYSGSIHIYYAMMDFEYFVFKRSSDY